MSSPVEEAHFTMFPGGEYATHAENEGKPIADWLGELGIRALRTQGRARSPAARNRLHGSHARSGANAGTTPAKDRATRFSPIPRLWWRRFQTPAYEPVIPVEPFDPRDDLKAR
jgi:hypothetical protein